MWSNFNLYYYAITIEIKAHQHYLMRSILDFQTFYLSNINPIICTTLIKRAIS